MDSSSEEEKAQIGVDSSVLTNVKVQGVSIFEESAFLRLDLEGSPDPIIFRPKPETIFGRRDPATGAMPDIDLTPFAGYRMGVSRRHAAIRRSDERGLDLWDLGSSNGTFLNGQRLNAHRPYRLHDGDELRLGQMVIRVYFQPTDTPGEEAKAVPPKTEEVQPAPVAAEAPPRISTPPKTVPTSFKPAEPVKPSFDAAEPAEAPKPAEAAKSPVEASKPAESPKPSAEVSKPPGKPAEASAKQAESAEPVTEAPKPATEADKPASKPAESPELAESARPEVPKPAAEAPKTEPVSKPSAPTEPKPPTTKPLEVPKENDKKRD